MSNQLKEKIIASLQKLSKEPILEGARELFDCLGYKSERRLSLSSDAEAFVNECGNAGKSIKPCDRNVIQAKCQTVEMVCQITSEEIKNSGVRDHFFQVNQTESYLFFAVELRQSSKEEVLTRLDLAEVTRSLNRIFGIPVLVLYRYAKEKIPHISIGIINRRPNKKDSSKIVLGQVNLIRDINTLHPHRAHVDILSLLSLAGLREEVRKSIESFSDLDASWQNVLATQELKNSFYRDLAGWYGWAFESLKTPKLEEKDLAIRKSDIEQRQYFLLRLISRMIFCWFLKEKGLINPYLMELDITNPSTNVIRDLLSGTNPSKSNSYYRGILQNVFFRCLNHPMSNKPNPRRYLGNKYRSKAFNLDNFESIPYLNGGLFDELPEDFSGDEQEVGFVLPNELFWKQRSTGDRLREKRIDVLKEGLNQILSRYKFTIEENSPLEEEVALDPELLGMVFENLLAELDEDSNKAAKKESGTYYTPRQIIEHMVNESLYLHLRKAFARLKRPGGEIGSLKNLVFATPSPSNFDRSNQDFCKVVVETLAAIKVLDPACGSGAFPMGMLQAMTRILKAVDPDSKEWLKLYERRSDRSKAKEIMAAHTSDYLRKLDLIQNCLYGIDIQPNAVLITKLRFFITLLIDQKINPLDRAHNYNITPLPNLETKLICADSLSDISDEQYHTPQAQKVKHLREQYHQPHEDPLDRKAIAKRICEHMADSYPNFSDVVLRPGLPKKGSKKESEGLFYEWFLHGSIAAPFFSVEMFFPEASESGFDIVIGNPPYGGTPISEDVKEALHLGSRDKYGAFIARFLGDGHRMTPLRNGGLLSYIVSDTFMTIRTHRPLREQIMANTVHKMIRVHPDTFRATVNTAIVLCEKEKASEEHKCLMADLTNLSIHDPSQHEQFREVFAKAMGISGEQNESNDIYAIFSYPQKLIKTNSNLPFFVGSPTLFTIMNDQTSSQRQEQIGGKLVTIRKVELDGKLIEVVKLGEIADIRQGLATGDNDSYLFQNPTARGNYRDISAYRSFILNEKDLIKIHEDQELRAQIVQKGFSKGDKSSRRYFGGRYILPYDKGGESNVEEGWLPNYYVPTNYFIDWSEWAVKRMRTLTIADRIRANKEKKPIKKNYENTTCAIFRSEDKYFSYGISFSRTGIYAPTFRLSSSALFDTEGSMIMLYDATQTLSLLGYLTSRFARYQLKSFIGHSVHAQVDELKELIIPIHLPDCAQIVRKIINAQQRVPKYSYNVEQQEIDVLVEQVLKISPKLRFELESWCLRRYPRINTPHDVQIEKAA